MLTNKEITAPSRLTGSSNEEAYATADSAEAEIGEDGIWHDEETPINAPLDETPSYSIEVPYDNGPHEVAGDRDDGSGDEGQDSDRGDDASDTDELALTSASEAPCYSRSSYGVPDGYLSKGSACPFCFSRDVLSAECRKRI